MQNLLQKTQREFKIDFRPVFKEKKCAKIQANSPKLETFLSSAVEIIDVFLGLLQENSS